MAGDDVPAMLPVALAEAKAYLRVSNAAQDAAIAAALRSACAHAEAYLGRALIARAVREAVPATSAWQRLTTAPVRAITGVARRRADGSEAALAPDDYAIDIDATGDGWVRLIAGDGVGAIVVDAVAGMASDWNGVPEPIRHGVLRLTAFLFEERAVDGAIPPAAVAALVAALSQDAAGMSALAAVQAAAMAALEADPALALQLTGVFGGPPPRAAMPYALLLPAQLSDWGTKDIPGREIRLAIAIVDEDETPDRAEALADSAAAAIGALPRDLDGWRIAGSVMLRQRTIAAGARRWRIEIEQRVRVLEIAAGADAGDI